MANYASNLLGSHNTDIKCIHQSGCTLPIPASELSRCLPEKQMTLWERLKQKRELEKAGLDDWEECPFCDWGCVMEVSTLEQRLFRCENEEICGIVSCRTCKKQVGLFLAVIRCSMAETHRFFPGWIRIIYRRHAEVCSTLSASDDIDLSDTEVEQDKALEGQHSIEEAMSATALIILFFRV